ncbi:MAG TPA: Rieske 2Fe-2S domain-containing protein [Acidimicrobiales bacterium]|nr:Rieske 2Fe-2S domain-containing protein [Acidimicrobiales bacterium]
MPTVQLCVLEDLEPDRGHRVRIGAYDVAVFLVDGGVRVVDNTCLHTGGPLADGAVFDGCVICPLHGWVYDLVTGQTLVGHRTAGNLGAYKAWIENGAVMAELG